MGVWGQTYAMECKQSRADFLRDAGVEVSAVRELGVVKEEVEELRQLLGVHLPDCRQGSVLFREFDEYDFGDLRHERWRRLVSRLSLLERKLAEGVKFSRLVRYASANFFYLVVEEGVLADAREIPPAWGCLVREGGSLRLEREATSLASPVNAKLAYLERISARASKLVAASRVNSESGA